MAERCDVLVIGGGLAGLSCATALAEAGRRVTVLEKMPGLGGRARSFGDPDTGLFWDNGPHLFAGACRQTSRFLRRIGTGAGLVLQERTRIGFADEDGMDSLQIPAALPGRFALLWAVWGLKGFGVADKWGLRRLRSALAASDTRGLEEIAAGEWFGSLGQSPAIVERLLAPLSMILLGVPPALVSAAVLAESLRELFTGGPDPMGLGWPAVPFGELYADPARTFIESRGGQVLVSTEVTRLIEDDGRVAGAADEWGQKFLADEVVLTLPPWDLKRLEVSQRLKGDWEGLGSSALACVHITFDRPVLDVPVAAMLGTTAAWAAARPENPGPVRGGAQRVSFVVSAGRDVLKASPAAFFDAAKRDMDKCFPDWQKARITAWKAVMEPDARLSHAPGSSERRPRPGPVLPGLSLAGDWTRTGLPASMESAVASGERAAEELIQHHA